VSVFHHGICFTLQQLGSLDYYFLGIEIHHLPNGSIPITQIRYIRLSLTNTL